MAGWIPPAAAHAASFCWARPGRSAPRPPTSSGATRTGSGWPGWRPAAATPACWPARRSSSGPRWWPWTSAAQARRPRLREAAARAARCTRHRPPKAARRAGRGGRGRGLALRRGAERGDRVGRPGRHAGRARRRARARAGQQGVADHRRPAGRRRWPRPGQIVPVDSEHSAIAQCLRGGRAGEVRRLVLTASGGPFRGRSRDELDGVTPEQALAHPTWNMGPVITVNSATLVNKGLEVIEAHLLFGIGVRPHRGGRAPAVGGPLDGRVHRRLDDRPGQPAGHADPDRAGPGLAGPGRRRRPGRWTGPRRTPGPSSRWTRRRSPRSRWPARRGGRAGPPRPSTTRPTRCAWTRSWPAGSPSPGSWTPWRR